MRRFFKIIFTIIILIMIIAVAGVAFFLAKPNAVTKKGVVEVLSFVLKTDVQLGGVDVSVSKGKCVLNDLVIKNPEGFEGNDAFSVGKIDVDVNAKVFNPLKPEIQAIMVENPQINLEINGKGSNLGKLSENASRMEKWKFKNLGNNVKIGKIVVDGAKVSMSTTKYKDKCVSFGLHRIEMDNVRGTVAGTIKAFFDRILRESVKAGKECILGLGDEEAIKSLKEAIGGVKDGVKDLKDGIKDKLGQ